MKKLNQAEWLAVVAGILIVGFFFIFGQTVVSLFNENISTMSPSQPKVISEEKNVGIGDEATVGSRVTVNYTGMFADGKVFDSSLTRGEPFQFILGSGQVIKGLDEGVVGMKVGGKRIFTIPPELGYGPNDYGPIPGNSTLIFEVELLKVEAQ